MSQSAKNEERVAGVTLDAEIASRVMGWTRMSVFESRPGLWLNHGFPPDGYHPFGAVPPRYSTEIEVAWVLVEKLREQMWDLTFGSDRGGAGWWIVGSSEDRDDSVIEVDGSTLPLAICLAALAAVSSPAGDLAGNQP